MPASQIVRIGHLSVNATYQVLGSLRESLGCRFVQSPCLFSGRSPCVCNSHSSSTNSVRTGSSASLP